MKEKESPIFSKRCFWEQDYTKLDFNEGKRYIIARVVSYGSQDDHIELPESVQKIPQFIVTQRINQ